MKKVIIAALMAATILPVKAQLFSRDALGGAVLGSVAINHDQSAAPNNGTISRANALLGR